MRLHFVALAVALSIVPTIALAAEPDAVKPDTKADPAPPPRTFLWNEEPRLPSSLKVVGISDATYASTDAARGFASNVAMPGGSIQMGAEVGLVSQRLSVEASAFEGGRFDTFGAMAGVRLSLLPTSWTTTHAVVSGGYVKELYSGNGAWGRLALSQDIDRVRLATTFHAQHVFVDGRDAVDVMVMLGANIRLSSIVRLGVEYVAQDLEAARDPSEAEGGMKHFLGPSASFALLHDRLTLGVGPAAGLSKTSPQLVGRFALAYAF